MPLSSRTPQGLIEAPPAYPGAYAIQISLVQNATRALRLDEQMSVTYGISAGARYSGYFSSQLWISTGSPHSPCCNPLIVTRR